MPPRTAQSGAETVPVRTPQNRTRTARRAPVQGERRAQPKTGRAPASVAQLGALKVLESEFQKKITDLCDYLHLKWHHEVDSRRSKKGFPDLVIAGKNEVIFAELKVGKNKVTEDQEKWLTALIEANARVYIWRPEDWGQIEVVLKRLAGR